MKVSIVVEVVLPNGRTETKKFHCQESKLKEKIAHKWPNYQDYTVLSGSSQQSRWV